MSLALPEVGSTFVDRYQLTALLGEGGFARVYRARDARMAREVALKVLMPNAGAYSQLSTARFLREAKLIAELQSPHTITMYDFGKSPGGLFWMAFEFVDGRDLRATLAEHGPLAGCSSRAWMRWRKRIPRASCTETSSQATSSCTSTQATHGRSNCWISVSRNR